jgi:hypothetical protein
MEAVSELLSLQAITDCQDVPAATIRYTSNSAVSNDLKEWLGDIAGTIDHAEWDVIWTNSQAAIHRLFGEYLHVFVVTFHDDLGNENRVFWVDRSCFVDR